MAARNCCVPVKGYRLTDEESNQDIVYPEESNDNHGRDTELAKGNCAEYLNVEIEDR